MFQSYQTHKRNARKRNIEFLISYEEWLDIWEKSGHLQQRGRGKGKYVMCRKNDIGPYQVGNVYIDLNEVNAGQARAGDKSSPTHINRIREALLGKKKSASSVAKNTIAQLSRPKYECIHCNRLISGQGNLKQHINSKHGVTE